MPDPIDPQLARALDAFTVPPLPDDFADRVADRAVSLPATPPLPRRRAPAARRWWRLGATTLGTIAAGVISISAAAMGYLGEPIAQAVQRAPVIGHVIERVIPTHTHPHHAVAVHSAAPPPPPAPIATPEPLPPRHPLIRRAIERVRAMPPEQRREWLASHPRLADRLARRREHRIERRLEQVEEPALRQRLLERRERIIERLESRRRERLEFAPRPLYD